MELTLTHDGVCLGTDHAKPEPRLDKRTYQSAYWQAAFAGSMPSEAGGSGGGYEDAIGYDGVPPPPVARDSNHSRLHLAPRRSVDKPRRFYAVPLLCRCLRKPSIPNRFGITTESFQIAAESSQITPESSQITTESIQDTPRVYAQLCALGMISAPFVPERLARGWGNPKLRMWS